MTRYRIRRVTNDEYLFGRNHLYPSPPPHPSAASPPPRPVDYVVEFRRIEWGSVPYNMSHFINSLLRWQQHYYRYTANNGSEYETYEEALRALRCCIAEHQLEKSDPQVKVWAHLPGEQEELW